jgi:hypothetical protein
MLTVMASLAAQWWRSQGQNVGSDDFVSETNSWFFSASTKRAHRMRPLYHSVMTARPVRAGRLTG